MSGEGIDVDFDLGALSPVVLLALVDFIFYSFILAVAPTLIHCP